MEEVRKKGPARLRSALAAFGASLAEDEVARALDELSARLRPRLGASYSYFHLVRALLAQLAPALGDEEAALLSDVYAGPRYRTWLFPGTHDALARLRGAGLTLGVIANTAWPGFCMERAFAGVGIREYFETMVISCDEGVAKPDPRIFRIAAQQAGVEGGRTLYAGDSPDADIAGATGVGWDAALRKSEGCAQDARAVVAFDRWDELVEFVLG